MYKFYTGLNSYNEDELKKKAIVDEADSTICSTELPDKPVESDGHIYMIMCATDGYVGPYRYKGVQKAIDDAADYSATSGRPYFVLRILATALASATVTDICGSVRN